MNKYVLEISGMKCGMCEAHVNNEIRNHLKVKSVSSSHVKNETIVITKEEISDEEFHKVIDPTGYTLGSIKKEEATRKLLSWK